MSDKIYEWEYRNPLLWMKMDNTDSEYAVDTKAAHSGLSVGRAGISKIAPVYAGRRVLRVGDMLGGQWYRDVAHFRDELADRTASLLQKRHLIESGKGIEMEKLGSPLLSRYDRLDEIDREIDAIYDEEQKMSEVAPLERDTRVRPPSEPSAPYRGPKNLDEYLKSDEFQNWSKTEGKMLGDNQLRNMVLDHPERSMLEQLGDLQYGRPTEEAGRLALARGGARYDHMINIWEDARFDLTDKVFNPESWAGTDIELMKIERQLQEQQVRREVAEIRKGWSEQALLRAAEEERASIGILSKGAGKITKFAAPKLESLGAKLGARVLNVSEDTAKGVISAIKKIPKLDFSKNVRLVARSGGRYALEISEEALSGLKAMGMGAMGGGVAQTVGLLLGASRKTQDYLMWGTAAAMLAEGDPMGAVFAAATTGIDALISGYIEQSRREKLSDKPEATYGKFFGYVREGQKWYPAYLAEKRIWHGPLGEHGNTIRLVYGQNAGGNIDMKRLSGEWVPHFNVWERQREFDVDDYTLTHKWGKDAQLKDGLRDWFFLSPEENQRVLHIGTDGKALSVQQVLALPKFSDFETFDDDPARYSMSTNGRHDAARWQKDMLDLKYSFDLMNQFHNEFNPDEGVFHNISGGTQGLYRVTNWNTGDDDEDGVLQNMVGPMGTTATKETLSYAGQMDGTRHFKSMDADYKYLWGSLGENKWLIKQVMDQVSTLIKVQRDAAAEAGYDPAQSEQRRAKIIYRSQFSSALANEGMNAFSQKQYLVEKTTPYRSYLDLGKALPTAHDVAQLQSQLTHIRGMRDRSYIQQQFLAQKAYVRYMMYQVDKRGGGDDLAKALYTPMEYHIGGTPTGDKAGKQKLMKFDTNVSEKTAGRLHNFDVDAQGLLYFDGSEFDGGYLPPWYSSDDKGVLPDFVRLNKDNQLLVAKSEADQKLVDARDLPLSHHSSKPPAELHSIVTGAVKPDYRHIDWKAPQNKYTREFLTGFDPLDDTKRKTGMLKKERREKYLEAQKHDYKVGPIIVPYGNVSSLDLNTRGTKAQQEVWDKHGYIWDVVVRKWKPKFIVHGSGAGKEVYEKDLSKILLGKFTPKGITGDNVSSVHSSWSTTPKPKIDLDAKPDPTSISWEVFQDPRVKAAEAQRKREEQAQAKYKRDQADYIKRMLEQKKKPKVPLPAEKPKVPLPAEKPKVALPAEKPEAQRKREEQAQAKYKREQADYLKRMLEQKKKPKVPLPVEKPARPPPMSFDLSTPAEKAAGQKETADHIEKWNQQLHHNPDTHPAHHDLQNVLNGVPSYVQAWSKPLAAIRESSAPSHIPIHVQPVAPSHPGNVMRAIRESSAPSHIPIHVQPVAPSHLGNVMRAIRESSAPSHIPTKP